MAALANDVSRFTYQSPWSQDCDGAPWWIDATAEARMKRFTERLLTESKCTPDAASMIHTEQLVFVYGSLKRGFPAHDMLENARLVGRGWTHLKRFRLYQAKDFPVALFVHTDEADAKALYGEVYLVPTTDIKHLDFFENNGTLFRRRKISILLDTGESKICWMYFGVSSVWKLEKLCPVFQRKKTGVEYYSYVRKGA